WPWVGCFGARPGGLTPRPPPQNNPRPICPSGEETHAEPSLQATRHVREPEPPPGLRHPPRVPGVHGDLSRHRPAGLRDPRTALHAGSPVRRTQVPEALPVVVPGRGPLLRAGDEPDPGGPGPRGLAPADDRDRQVQRAWRNLEHGGGPLHARRERRNQEGSVGPEGRLSSGLTPRGPHPPARSKLADLRRWTSGPQSDRRGPSRHQRRSPRLQEPNRLDATRTETKHSACLACHTPVAIPVEGPGA